MPPLNEGVTSGEMIKSCVGLSTNQKSELSNCLPDTLSKNPTSPRSLVLIDPSHFRHCLWFSKEALLEVLTNYEPSFSRLVLPSNQHNGKEGTFQVS